MLMTRLCLLLTLLFAGTVAHAQWELIFCTSDSADCQGKSDLFIWNGEATVVYGLLKNKNELAVTKLEYRIYEVKNDVTEKLYARVKTFPAPSLNWATKKIYFVKPGYYRVEVYDEKLSRLASEYVTITDRPE